MVTTTKNVRNLMLFYMLTCLEYTNNLVFVDMSVDNLHLGYDGLLSG